MNENTFAIVTLCSHLCPAEGVEPLEPREWSSLAQRLMAAGIQPGDLLRLSREELGTRLGLDEAAAGRIRRLAERGPSLGFALEKYADMGIYVLTRADAAYPRQLKKKLRELCPPLFYCAGDPSLLTGKTVGYVGARSIQPEDLDFTREQVRKTVSLGYGVVSGGARGVDTVAGTEALQSGGTCIEYLSDSMMKKLKSSDTLRGIQEGRLLLLSAAGPDTGFQVGLAMMRNRYIYAQSEATVVIHSDLNKGGTWAGAVDALKNGWCPVLCRDCAYPGNRALIQKGALPIGADWDGTLPAQKAPVPEAEYRQTSLFDMT